MEPITIVVADDHAIMRESVVRIIACEQDMSVVGRANNGAQLVTMCRELQPTIAITDFSMPFDEDVRELGGIEAIEQLREICPSTRVIVLTMHDDVHYLRRALKAGAAGYLVKRDSGSVLISAIRDVAAGRSCVRVSLDSEALRAVVRRHTPTPTSAPQDVMSEREHDVIKLVASGYSNKEVAAELGLAPKSISTIRARACEKLGIKGRAAIVRYALRTGMLETRQ